MSRSERMAVCPICGKEFSAYGHKIYCSKECVNKVQYTPPGERYINRRKREGTFLRDQNAAAQIARDARAAGMSYGQYVAKMGL